MRQGQSILELLLTMALLAIVLPAMSTGLVSSRQGKIQTDKRIEAAELLKETQEAVRIVRESNWSNVTTNGVYHPVISGSTWSLAADPETINGITRQVELFDVYRDSNFLIVTNGGTLDPSSKRAVITISWTDPQPGSLTSTLYITRYLDNATYTQTTQAQFDTGTKTNVTSTNTNGGDIRLAYNTKAKWCEPQLSSAVLDLPGLPNAVWATEGHVYVATGQTANASQDSFAHVLVANTDPPTSSLHGKIQGYKTNAVFGEPNYGYITTTDNSREVVIIDLNDYEDVPNKIYRQVGYFNPSSTTDADAIFVYNNRGYVTISNYLYVFNLSAKTGARAQIGNRISFADSGDIANEIYVRQVGSSTYAFVAVEGSTVDEMKILNVTNHGSSSTWRVISGLNIEPNNCSSLESGKAIYIKPDGSRAYLSSVNDQNSREFYTLNTSNKSSPSVVGGFATNPPCTNGGGYEAGGMNPQQSIVVSSQENRAVLVGVDDPSDGTNAQEYQVLDLTNEANPSKCGGLDVDQGIFGVAGVTESDGDTYAYIITGDSSNELKIIQGGLDGTYVESGVYESAAFDPGYASSFNRFIPTQTTPANTSVAYKVAIADPVNGSCSGANYVFTGPDGTTNTSYTTTSPITFHNDNVGYENPARCFKYQAILSTTNANTTPIFEETVVNYSP